MKCLEIYLYVWYMENIEVVTVVTLKKISEQKVIVTGDDYPINSNAK